MSSYLGRRRVVTGSQQGINNSPLGLLGQLGSLYQLVLVCHCSWETILLSDSHNTQTGGGPHTGPHTAGIMVY